MNARFTRILLSQLSSKHGVNPTQKTIDRVIDDAYPLVGDNPICAGCGQPYLDCVCPRDPRRK